MYGQGYSLVVQCLPGKHKHKGSNTEKKVEGPRKLIIFNCDHYYNLLAT